MLIVVAENGFYASSLIYYLEKKYIVFFQNQIKLSCIKALFAVRQVLRNVLE